MCQSVLKYPSTYLCFSELYLERFWGQGASQRCHHDSETGTHTCVGQWAFCGKCFPVSKWLDLALNSISPSLSSFISQRGSIGFQTKWKRGSPPPMKPDMISHYLFKVLFMSIKIVVFPTKDLFLFLTITNINSKSTAYGCGVESKVLSSKTDHWSL